MNNLLIEFHKHHITFDTGTGGAIHISSLFDKDGTNNVGSTANSITISNTLFESNKADRSGGAAYILQAAALSGQLVSFSNTTFRNNKAQINPDDTVTFNRGGGAIAYIPVTQTAFTNSLKLENCKFIDNTAESKKGQAMLVFLRKPSGVTLQNWMQNPDPAASPKLHLTIENSVYADTEYKENAFYGIGFEVTLVDANHANKGNLLSELTGSTEFNPSEGAEMFNQPIQSSTFWRWCK